MLECHIRFCYGHTAAVRVEARDDCILHVCTDKYAAKLLQNMQPIQNEL